MNYKISLISLISLSLIACGEGTDTPNSANPQADPNLLINQNRPESTAIIKDEITAYINADNYEQIARRVYTNLYIALSASSYIIKKDRSGFDEKSGSCTLGGFARTQTNLQNYGLLQPQSKISSTYVNCYENYVTYNGTSGFTLQSIIRHNGKTAEELATTNKLTISYATGFQWGNSWELDGDALVQYRAKNPQNPILATSTAIYSDFRYNFSGDKLNGYGIVGYIDDDLNAIEVRNKSRQELKGIGTVAFSTSGLMRFSNSKLANNKLADGQIRIRGKNGIIIIRSTESSPEITIKVEYEDEV